jgi:hypothetical protein
MDILCASLISRVIGYNKLRSSSHMQSDMLIAANFKHTLFVVSTLGTSRGGDTMHDAMVGIRRPVVSHYLSQARDSLCDYLRILLRFNAR